MNFQKKIKDLEELKKISEQKKKKNKKIILCHGVFDLIHIGHIMHLNEAKSLGDILIVTITDENRIFKGPGRPYFNNKERLKSLAALGVVDYVAISNLDTGVFSIKTIKPNFYCKGQDYSSNMKDLTGNIKLEKQALKQVGGKLHITNQVQKSSSKLINNFSDIFDNEKKKFIEKIKKTIDIKKIDKWFYSFKNKKVLIIGETIIDEYVFCEALGKSGKDPILVMREINLERYLGGAAAIAKNLSTFCEKVKLISIVGEKEEHLNFIKKKLPANVNSTFYRKKNSTTIVKKRYVDHINKNKVFGSYLLNDEYLDVTNEKKLSNDLSKSLKKYDLVIVLDYGHGMLSPKVAKIIYQKSKFLCLNAQINASNISYHSLSNYKKNECIIINETELRRELRSRDGSIKKLMKILSLKMNTKKVVVTRGSNGALLYDKKNNSFVHCPAFADKIIDKIGAGDSFLATLSLSLASKLNTELSMLIGSLSASINIENFANKNSLDKIKILKSLRHVLK